MYTMKATKTLTTVMNIQQVNRVTCTKFLLRPDDNKTMLRTLCKNQKCITLPAHSSIQSTEWYLSKR